MRVLLTGAAGSIGRVLSVGLSDRDHEVVGLDLVPQPDDAEHWADRIEPRPGEAAEIAVVGGDYALPSYDRPALDRS